MLACLPASGVCSQLSATTTRWRIFQEELRGRRERATTSAPRRSSGDDDVGAFVADSLSADAEWSLKVDDGTTKVWRRAVKGSAYDEVRGNTIMDAPPAAVLALMRSNDADVIRKYNPMYEDGYALEAEDDGATRVSYALVRGVFPFKPRDTVTRVAERPVPAEHDGGTVLLLRAVDHAKMPPQKEYVRAQILRGMNLMQPVAGRPDQTNFTFCTHVNTGGIVPAWLMNVLITQDSVAFLKRLGKEAQAQKGRAPKQKQQQPAFMTPAAVEHLVRDGGPDAGPPVVHASSRRHGRMRSPVVPRAPAVRVRRSPVV